MARDDRLSTRESAQWVQPAARSRDTLCTHQSHRLHSGRICRCLLHACFVTVQLYSLRAWNLFVSINGLLVWNIKLFILLLANCCWSVNYIDVLYVCVTTSLFSQYAKHCFTFYCIVWTATNSGCKPNCRLSLLVICISSCFVLSVWRAGLMYDTLNYCMTWWWWTGGILVRTNWTSHFRSSFYTWLYRL